MPRRATTRGGHTVHPGASRHRSAMRSGELPRAALLPTTHEHARSVATHWSDVEPALEAPFAGAEVARKDLRIEERPTQPNAVVDSLHVIESQASRGAWDVDDLARLTQRGDVSLHDRNPVAARGAARVSRSVAS